MSPEASPAAPAAEPVAVVPAAPTPEEAQKDRDDRLNNLIAILVTITATFMALCNVKDGNVVQAMSVSQAKTIDEWSYYQAKGTKQNLALSMVDQLTVQKEITAGLTPETQKLLDEKIVFFTAKAKGYEKDKEEIKARAVALQKDYDELNIHDDQFDISEALLSVAIALFSVTALTRRGWLLAVATLFTAFGIALGLAGFLKLGFHPDFLARLIG